MIELPRLDAEMQRAIRVCEPEIADSVTQWFAFIAWSEACVEDGARRGGGALMKSVEDVGKMARNIVDAAVDAGTLVGAHPSGKSADSARFGAFAKRARQLGLKASLLREPVDSVPLQIARPNPRDWAQLDQVLFKVGSVPLRVTLMLMGESEEIARRVGDKLGSATMLAMPLFNVSASLSRGQIDFPGSLLDEHGVKREDLVASKMTPALEALATAFEARIDAAMKAAESEFGTLAIPAAREFTAATVRAHNARMEKFRASGRTLFPTPTAKGAGARLMSIFRRDR